VVEIHQVKDATCLVRKVRPERVDYRNEEHEMRVVEGSDFER
jgi:hypothetical protein